MLPKYKIPIIILHILFWLLSSYFFITFFSIEREEISINADGQTITETYYDALLQEGLTIGILIRLFFFYSHLRYVIPFITSRNFLKYLMVFTILISFCFLAENLIQAELYHTWPVPGVARIFIFIYTFYALTSLGYGLYMAWHEAEKSKSDLRQQVIQTELTSLKAQFDPHFVFNTLNSLLYIAEKEGSQSISAAIEEMSSLMRSVIYDFGAQTIPLSKEVNLIKQYINLQKLKYDEKDEIDIAINTDPEISKLEPSIAPLILLPFVENAFKHGIDIYNPSFIHIDIKIIGDQLRFIVENSDYSNSENSPNGIGLDNMKKRLQLLYTNHYTLNIKPGDPYEIELTLDYLHAPPSTS